MPQNLYRATLCAVSRELTDKVIVITGASSGIGAATAEACAAAGMDVAMCARRADKLETIVKRIEAQGRVALTVAGDVNDASVQQRLFEQAWARFGRVDALFANAGHGMFGSVLDTPEADHRAIFETNYFATLTTLRVGVPYLRRTDGGLQHVLICSSAGSEIGVPWFGAYTATKAAQDSIAGALRGELAEEGIAVTSIHPVGTKTEFFDTAQARSPETEGAKPAGGNTPVAATQRVERVSASIVRALRHPKPEVWPMRSARFALALTTAMPRTAAWIIKRQARAR